MQCELVRNRRQNSTKSVEVSMLVYSDDRFPMLGHPKFLVSGMTITSVLFGVSEVS